MATITTAAGYTWQQVAEDRQKHRDATIAVVTPPLPAVPEELPLNVTGIPQQILTSEEIKITELKVEELVPALAEGKLTSVDVTNAFLRRAALAQALVSLAAYLSRCALMFNPKQRSTGSRNTMTSKYVADLFNR